MVWIGQGAVRCDERKRRGQDEDQPGELFASLDVGAVGHASPLTAEDLKERPATPVRATGRFEIQKRLEAQSACSGFPLRFVDAIFSSSFSLIDIIDFDAPFSSLFGVSPRFADKAAPAAFCWAFDLAGIGLLLSRHKRLEGANASSCNRLRGSLWPLPKLKSAC
jgi:hypothetical protein